MRYMLLLLTLVVVFNCAKKQVVKQEEPQPVVVEEPKPVEVPKPVEPPKPELVLQRIFFDFDKYEIRTDAADILKKNAEMLKIYPNVKIVIEGHCCEIGTSEYNMALGEKRAKAARDYLVNLGISSDRISIVSYGEERPLDKTDLKKNRRCEFVVK